MTAMGAIFAKYVYEEKQDITNVPPVYLDEVHALIKQWEEEKEAAAAADQPLEGGE